MNEHADILHDGNQNGSVIMSFLYFCMFVITGIAGTGNTQRVAEAVVSVVDENSVQHVAPWLQSHYIGPLQYTEFFQVLATIFVCVNLIKWLITVVEFLKKLARKSKSRKKKPEPEKIKTMGGNGGGGPEEEIEKED